MKTAYIILSFLVVAGVLYFAYKSKKKDQPTPQQPPLPPPVPQAAPLQPSPLNGVNNASNNPSNPAQVNTNNIGQPAITTPSGPSIGFFTSKTSAPAIMITNLINKPSLFAPGFATSWYNAIQAGQTTFKDSFGQTYNTSTGSILKGMAV